MLCRGGMPGQLPTPPAVKGSIFPRALESGGPPPGGPSQGIAGPLCIGTGWTNLQVRRKRDTVVSVQFMVGPPGGRPSHPVGGAPNFVIHPLCTHMLLLCVEGVYTQPAPTNPTDCLNSFATGNG